VKPWIKYFLVGLVAFIIGAAASSSETATVTTETVTVSEEAAPVEEPEVAAEPEPTGPQIESDLLCDYNLDPSASGDSAGTFIAGGSVTNNGDEMATVTVTARWSLLGSSPARASKRVRIPADGEREVQISRQMSLNEVSAYQSGGTKCRVRAR
jgi:hypothetical protein